MKALFFKNHGDISNLEYGEITDKKPKSDEILISVKACAINHLDLWVLKGWPSLKLELPHIGGADIAGVIIELGSDVRNLKIGDRVALTPGFIPTNYQDEFTKKGEENLSPEFKIFGENIRGGFAELIIAPAHTAIKIPENLSFSEAAAPLLVATTAWQMLIKRAQVKKDETVLFVGAGGGLNSFSMILAKKLHTKIIALTSSEEKEAKAKKLGADFTINYLNFPDWHKEVKKITEGKGVDIVVDNVGAKTFNKSILSLKRGGRLVTVGNTSGPELNLDNRLIFSKQISILGSTMGSQKDTEDAVNFAWNNLNPLLIDSEFPLNAGKDAYIALQTGRQFGKILLIP